MLVSLRFFGFHCYNQWLTVPQPVGFGATTMLKKRVHNHNQTNPIPQSKSKIKPRTQPPRKLAHTKTFNNNQKKNSTIHDHPELSNKQPTAFAKPKQRKLLKQAFTPANSTVVLLMRKKLKYCQSRNNK